MIPLIRDLHPGSGSQNRILIFYPSWISDPGVKKAPDPGSARSKLLNFQGVVLLPPSQEEKAEAAATATAPILLGQFRNERCCIRCEEVRHRIILEKIKEVQVTIEEEIYCI